MGLKGGAGAAWGRSRGGELITAVERKSHVFFLYRKKNDRIEVRNTTTANDDDDDKNNCKNDNNKI